MPGFRASATSAIELALVLGTELLWGDGPSPGIRGGVGAAEVSIGGGIGGGSPLFVCRVGTLGQLL